MVPKPVMVLMIAALGLGYDSARNPNTDRQLIHSIALVWIGYRAGTCTHHNIGRGVTRGSMQWGTATASMGPDIAFADIGPYRRIIIRRPTQNGVR